MHQPLALRKYCTQILLLQYVHQTLGPASYNRGYLTGR
jgi:hypothetical protein